MNRVIHENLLAEYTNRFCRSAELYAHGRDVIPDGVTHDSRYLTPFPVYVDRSSGSRKYSVEGHELIDWWSGHGALLLGHGHPAIVKAVQSQIARGSHWSACHEPELEWADLVIDLVPSAEMVRFTNSGTEATLMAVRIARIHTGRTKVLKFAGHFHGWHDQLIPAAEPLPAGRGYEMPGVTSSVSEDLVIVPPNDITALEAAIEAHKPSCVILEPTGGRWGVVPIRAEFLRQVREITERAGVLLTFDEVITGFRVSPGGAQKAWDVTPDMTTLAKVLAGGLPGACLAGRRDLMMHLSFNDPSGRKMKHPGTFNANPLSAAAGCAALKIIATGEPCLRAGEVGRKTRKALNDLFAAKNAPWIAYGDFFAINICPDYDGPRPTTDDFLPFDGAFTKLERSYDTGYLHAFRRALLVHGVDWMGWHGMSSAAHTDEDIEKTTEGFAGAIELLRSDGVIS